MRRRVLGVIGGVGPLSTAYFMEVVIRMTDASSDQEHLDMVVLNHTEIPDRTDYILDPRNPNPSPMMQEDARKLERLGADVIVTPCNTAHYFYAELASAVQVPFLHMIDETALLLRQCRCKRAGILATNGTIASGLFQQSLASQGIEAVLPSPRCQQAIMELIYQGIKAGLPLDAGLFRSAADELRAEGCERIVLGCTELSLLKKEYGLDPFYLDAMEVLAMRSIEACEKTVKKEAKLEIFGKPCEA